MDWLGIALKVLPSLIEGGATFLTQKGKQDAENQQLQRNMDFQAAQNSLNRELQLSLADKQLQAALAQVGMQWKMAKLQQTGGAFESLRNAYMSGAGLTSGSLNNLTQNIQRGTGANTRR